MDDRKCFSLFGYPDIRFRIFWIFRIFSLYGHNINPRLLKFGMNDLQGGIEDFRYSDIRISDFGFFRIFSLYGHNIEPTLMKFGMNVSKGCAKVFPPRLLQIFSTLWISSDFENHGCLRAKRATFI